MLIFILSQGVYHISFAYKVGQYLTDECPQPIATTSTHNVTLYNIYAYLMLISRIRREHGAPVFDHVGGQYMKKWKSCNKVDIIYLTVGKPNMTIYRTTRIGGHEIGTDRSSQTGQYLHIDRYTGKFGRPGGCGLGFWTNLPWTDLFLQFDPRMLAGQGDLLLILVLSHIQ